MENLKIGIIGIGNMGSAHANCIARGEIEGMKLWAVCDIDKTKIAEFKKIYPDVNSYSDFNQLLKDKNLDAVIIAVPHPLHSKMAIKAFENGLNVLLEKPADISVSKVQLLNKAAKETGKVFSMMFNQRTHPLFCKAREIVNSGKLGELKRVNWVVTNWYRTQHYYDSGDWRATWAGEGGGVLLNQAPHNLDLLQWICGMPESVVGFCDVARYHNIEVEDDVTIYLKYKNGATGTFITSTGEFPGTNRLEIIGEFGKIVLENNLLKWWQLNESERDFCYKSNKSFAAIDYDYSEYKNEDSESGHKGILQNFANAILFGEELIARGEEGINELTISNAAYLSEWLCNKEIKLPMDNKKFDKLLNAKIKSSAFESKNDSVKLTENYKERWQVNW
ncbi:MAG: Gfo/Idh/MocA family oxidoreductase [Clostridia bacterium]|nr:Gfo/Idh/MocA family oxidoreductase [Clostridia bacterium]